jgi:hypothetical protein
MRSLFLGSIERTNSIQVLIQSYRLPFVKLTSCGFEHERLHAIKNDNEVVMRRLRSLSNQTLQLQLQHCHTYELKCEAHFGICRHMTRQFGCIVSVRCGGFCVYEELAFRGRFGTGFFPVFSGRRIVSGKRDSPPSH